MKFTLTYEGELVANGRPLKKWEIRKQLHPQLQELWRVNPSIKQAERNRMVPAESSFFLMDTHHSSDATPQAPRNIGNSIDLCAPIESGGKIFLPLVRETFALTCALKILFLRKEVPGRLVYQGGDIDNRLKTLFDALAVPLPEQVMDDPTIDQPIYCLLENDERITGFDVQTHRLLSQPDVSEHYVKLIIEVDVRVTQARIYNQYFLGD
ncbi:MAG: hypothetical protein ACHQRJ_18735 [Alphaproteobacteria bacterium]